MQAFLLITTAPETNQLSDITAYCRSLTHHDPIILSQSQELGQAVMVAIDDVPSVAIHRDWAERHLCDANILASPPQKKSLLLSDMDCTIITEESLDALSEMAGMGEAVKAITARAMAGEINFAEALKERLLMLKGQPADLLDAIIKQTEIFDGADKLIGTMTKHGTRCLLVSGGFTFLTAPISEKLGFHHHFANDLAITDDKLAGYANPPILDGTSKYRIMHEEMAELGITSDAVMTIGDGANDLPMLKAAGLGVAWRAKQAVKDQIALQLNHSSHCGGLFLQGYSETEII